MLNRLNSPTLAIQTKDGRTESVVVPCGTVLKTSSSLSDTGFIECEWDGHAVTILTLDLHQRGERIELAT